MYRLSVPQFDGKTAEAVVDSWAVGEGEPVRPGAVVCRLRVTKVRRRPRSKDAGRVLDDAGGETGAPARISRLGFGLHLDVVAEQSGVLGAVSAVPGTTVVEGTPLALVVSDDAPGEEAPHLEFRAHTELVKDPTAQLRHGSASKGLRGRAGRTMRQVKSLGPSAKTRAGKIRDRVAPSPDFKSDETVEYRSELSVVIRCRREPAPLRGIYLFGGCDLPAFFHLAPRLRATTGTWVIERGSTSLAVSRSDRQLWLLDNAARDADELLERLRLPADYFEPRLFEPTFDTTIRGVDEVPKTVVVLSGAADLIRPLYRRKSTGTLVDPGAGWLGGKLAWARGDVELQNWFRKEFESVPRRSTAQIRQDMEALTRAIRERTGASLVLINNTLTVEPNDATHNFQYRPRAEILRRREFLLMLDDMSRADPCVRIVDVDRTLKMAGVDEQLDFAHFPDERYPEIGREAARLLEHAQILSDAAPV